MSHNKSLFCFFSALTINVFPSVSLGQETETPSKEPATPIYQPPTGEQPVFGKKYYGGQEKADIVFEINPAELIFRGLGLDFEKRIDQKTYTLGGSLRYRKLSFYSKNGFSADSEYFGVAPQIRIYPTELLSGVFFGFKLNLGTLTASIEGNNDNSQKTFTIVAPTGHVGYRFLGGRGLAFAIYAGGGLNLSKIEFKKSDLDGRHKESSTPEGSSAEDARKKFNSTQGFFVPDIGIAVGMAL